jgi:long-chain acyl-CoA synthetase
MLNLSALLTDSAAKVPDREAVVCGDTRLTYAQVEAMSNQVANLLVASGLQPGDKVGLTCPNLPWFPVVYFGILKAGCVVAPFNVLLKRREIAYHLNDSDAKAYFCFQGLPDLPMGEEGYAAFGESPGCEHFVVLPLDASAPSPIDGTTTLPQAISSQPATFAPVATSAEDTAVILYTSGTTGQPKGAELTHANMLLNAQVMSNIHPRAEHDVILIALPLFHSFGQTVQQNTGFLTRSTLVLLPRFEPGAAWRLMQAEKVTAFAGVPTMWWALLNYTDEAGELDMEAIASRLAKVTSGGSAIPVEVLTQIRERFGIPLLEGYGLSETSPVATFNQLDREPKAGSVGYPIWGVEAKLIDPEWNDVEGEGPGEIAIRGHNVMKGYYKRPDATAEAIRDGWFRTGDIARRDSDGFYYIVDRSKDMIIRGGFNVYPREIEEVMMTHPAVSLVAVVGVPHDRHGEEIKAYVVPKDGATADPDEIVAWCKDEMAAHKYPRLVEVVDSLPMTATGKILKRELRDK